MNRFIPVAIAAFLGIFALAALAFSAVAGLVVAAGLVAVRAISRLMPGRKSELSGHTADKHGAYRVWNDGRGTIIDMEAAPSR